MKRYSKKLTLTRIESWAMPGVPDLLLCEPSGRFSMVELKVTANHAVELSPHQISFLTKHQHAPAWILILRQRGMTKPAEVYLYAGRHAIDLRMEGIDKVNPVAHETEPVNWANIFRLMFETGDDKVA